MGYRIDVDQSGCINCGICMDVCPVEALDMSRPTAPGIEAGQGFARPFSWAMEHPIQVGRVHRLHASASSSARSAS